MRLVVAKQAEVIARLACLGGSVELNFGCFGSFKDVKIWYLNKTNKQIMIKERMNIECS